MGRCELLSDKKNMSTMHGIKYDKSACAYLQIMQE